jgi:hypothetical protein
MNDLLMIKAALAKQENQIAALDQKLDRAIKLIYASLSPEQKAKVDAASLAAVSRTVGKPPPGR